MILAIDPGFRDLGVCLMAPDKTVLEVYTLSTDARGMQAAVQDLTLQILKRKPPVVDLLVVEGQEVYRGAKNNPNDLLGVAQVAGACLGHFGATAKKILIPVPKVWKGSIAKQPHQARTCKRMGWEYSPRSGYVVADFPAHLGKFLPEESKEILDAVGLCLWGLSL